MSIKNGKAGKPLVEQQALYDVYFYDRDWNEVRHLQKTSIPWIEAMTLFQLWTVSKAREKADKQSILDIFYGVISITIEVSNA